MAQVGAHDIFDVVLIDTGNAVQKGMECMCPAAFMAAETADAQPDDAVRGLQTTQVIAMDREAGGMAACTCELVELDGGKDVIIVFLV